MTQKPSGRLLSLDVLRGITIAGMIMVNNSGAGEYTYAPLKHVAWDGLTPTDLVFPFFMFIMGISTYISLRKFNFEFNTPTLLKILKRTIVIFLIGLGLSWLGLSFRTYYMPELDNLGFWERFFRAITNFGHLRTLGVMQRLALTYGAASFIAITVKHKYIPYIIGTTLIAYFLLLLFGNGFEKSEDSIVSIVDQAILGVNHMYKDSGLALDPEGLLSAIPAIAHVLIGFCCGALMMNTKDNDKRISRLFIVGTILTFAGFLLSYGCPINKKIWTPTFVLATCGLASLLLALLIWIIDIKGRKKWSIFFESFGVNPLFIYVMAGVLGTLAYQAVFAYNGEYISAKGYIYSVLYQPYLGDYFGALIYSLIFVGICWIVGNILYKKNIYIKI
jgi:predicted acyltransferase